MWKPNRSVRNSRRHVSRRRRPQRSEAAVASNQAFFEGDGTHDAAAPILACRLRNALVVPSDFFGAQLLALTLVKPPLLGISLRVGSPSSIPVAHAFLLVMF